LTKLAQGHLDLHSKRSSVDMDKLAQTAMAQGALKETAAEISTANTAMQALEICQAAGVPLVNAIAKGARETAMASLGGGTDIAIIIYDRQGVRVGTSDA